MPGKLVLGVSRPPGPPTGLPEHPHNNRQLASQSESRAEAAVSCKLALDIGSHFCRILLVSQVDAGPVGGKNTGCVYRRLTTLPPTGNTAMCPQDRQEGRQAW